MVNYYELEQHIESYMRTEQVPGLALALVEDGEISYARGFGFTSIEEGGVPASPETLFRLNSITKSLVATAVMRMVEAGQLELDRPVKEYITWLKFSVKGAEERITLRMLLSHTSGLPKDARVLNKRDPQELAIFVREIIPQYRFVAEPGKVFSYSNAAFSLVGYIMEVVSGKLFTELMQELIFRPLTMTHTTFDALLAMTYPLAQSHERLLAGSLRVDRSHCENTANFPAGSGTYTNVLDMTKFIALHQQAGQFQRQQLLTPRSIAAMHTPQVDLYSSYHGGYGLGMGTRTYRAGSIPALEHNGAGGNYTSHMVIFPEQRIGAIILLNTDVVIHNLIFTLVDRLIKAPPTSLPKPEQTTEPALLVRYVGTYLGTRTGLVKISLLEQQLTMTLNNQPITLQIQRPSVYLGTRPNGSIFSVGFVHEEVGPVQYLMVDRWPCQRIEIDPTFKPDPLSWARYIGNYTCAVDPKVVSLRVENEQLFFSDHENGQEMLCIPLDTMRFTCQAGLLELQTCQNNEQPAIILIGVYTFTMIERQ